MHVVSWAKRFLFRTEQLELAVERLSGGERARVAIANLMLQPADVLMLDEPTNDLDINTLEVLEANLLDFTGALVLVTHDRYMLDRVSTIVLGLDGKGDSGLFADYSQWEQFRTESARDLKVEAPVAAETAGVRAAKKRLSYHEQREWDQMETLIHAAEDKLASRAARARRSCRHERSQDGCRSVMRSFSPRRPKSTGYTSVGPNSSQRSRVDGLLKFHHRIRRRALRQLNLSNNFLIRNRDHVNRIGGLSRDKGPLAVVRDMA